MQKKILYIFLLFICVKANAQYYNAAGGIAGGTPLKLALHNIIKGHNALAYADLWNAFSATDTKPNGKVWDIYSYKFTGAQPYEYAHFTNQCGQYSQEGDCYNREHTWPQSYFDSANTNFLTIKSDLFHVYPTDGTVNGIRGNLAYGIVSNATKTTLNGSKMGTGNTYVNGGDLFEPIDSFKGDLARSYFYMNTRYHTEDGGWSNWVMANGAELKPAAITLLLNWHHLDPVSQKEKDRNAAIFARQGNRNPFIDFPEYADCIWGSGNCTTVSVQAIQNNTSIRIYPNPTNNFLNIELPIKNVNATAEIYNTYGIQVLNSTLTNNIINISALQNGVYFLKLITNVGVFTKKFVKL